MNILTFLGQSPTAIVTMSVAFVTMAVALLVVTTCIKDKTSKVIPTLFGSVLVTFTIVIFSLLSHQAMTENDTQTASVDTHPIEIQTKI